MVPAEVDWAFGAVVVQSAFVVEAEAVWASRHTEECMGVEEADTAAAAGTAAHIAAFEDIVDFASDCRPASLVGLLEIGRVGYAGEDGRADIEVSSALSSDMILDNAPSYTELAHLAV